MLVQAASLWLIYLVSLLKMALIITFGCSAALRIEECGYLVTKWGKVVHINWVELLTEHLENTKLGYKMRSYCLESSKFDPILKECWRDWNPVQVVDLEDWGQMSSIVNIKEDRASGLWGYDLSVAHDMNWSTGIASEYKIHSGQYLPLWQM